MANLFLPRSFRRWHGPHQSPDPDYAVPLVYSFVDNELTRARPRPKAQRQRPPARRLPLQPLPPRRAAPPALSGAVEEESAAEEEEEEEDAWEEEAARELDGAECCAEIAAGCPFWELSGLGLGRTALPAFANFEQRDGAPIELAAAVERIARAAASWRPDADIPVARRALRRLWALERRDLRKLVDASVRWIADDEPEDAFESLPQTGAGRLRAFALAPPDAFATERAAREVAAALLEIDDAPIAPNAPRDADLRAIADGAGGVALAAFARVDVRAVRGARRGIAVARGAVEGLMEEIAGRAAETAPVAGNAIADADIPLVLPDRLDDRLPALFAGSADRTTLAGFSNREPCSFVGPARARRIAERTVMGGALPLVPNAIDSEAIRDVVESDLSDGAPGALVLACDSSQCVALFRARDARSFATPEATLGITERITDEVGLPLAENTADQGVLLAVASIEGLGNGIGKENDITVITHFTVCAGQAYATDPVTRPLADAMSIEVGVALEANVPEAAAVQAIAGDANKISAAGDVSVQVFERFTARDPRIFASVDITRARAESLFEEARLPLVENVPDSEAINAMASDGDTAKAIVELPVPALAGLEFFSARDSRSFATPAASRPLAESLFGEGPWPLFSNIPTEGSVRAIVDRDILAEAGQNIIDLSPLGGFPNFTVCASQSYATPAVTKPMIEAFFNEAQWPISLNTPAKEIAPIIVDWDVLAEEEEIVMGLCSLRVFPHFTVRDSRAFAPNSITDSVTEDLFSATPLPLCGNNVDDDALCQVASTKFFGEEPNDTIGFANLCTLDHFTPRDPRSFVKRTTTGSLEEILFAEVQWPLSDNIIDEESVRAIASDPSMDREMDAVNTVFSLSSLENYTARDSRSFATGPVTRPLMEDFLAELSLPFSRNTVDNCDILAIAADGPFDEELAEIGVNCDSRGLGQFTRRDSRAFATTPFTRAWAESALARMPVPLCPNTFNDDSVLQIAADDPLDRELAGTIDFNHINPLERFTGRDPRSFATRAFIDSFTETAFTEFSFPISGNAVDSDGIDQMIYDWNFDIDLSDVTDEARVNPLGQFARRDPRSFATATLVRSFTEILFVEHSLPLCENTTDDVDVLVIAADDSPDPDLREVGDVFSMRLLERFTGRDSRALATVAFTHGLTETIYRETALPLLGNTINETTIHAITPRCSFKQELRDIARFCCPQGLEGFCIRDARAFVTGESILSIKRFVADADLPLCSNASSAAAVRSIVSKSVLTGLLRVCVIENCLPILHFTERDPLAFFPWPFTEAIVDRALAKTRLPLGPNIASPADLSAMLAPDLVDGVESTIFPANAESPVMRFISRDSRSYATRAVSCALISALLAQSGFPLSPNAADETAVAEFLAPDLLVNTFVSILPVAPLPLPCFASRDARFFVSSADTAAFITSFIASWTLPLCVNTVPQTVVPSIVADLLASPASPLAVPPAFAPLRAWSPRDPLSCADPASIRSILAQLVSDSPPPVVANAIRPEDAAAISSAVPFSDVSPFAAVSIDQLALSSKSIQLYVNDAIGFAILTALYAACRIPVAKNVAEADSVLAIASGAPPGLTAIADRDGTGPLANYAARPPVLAGKRVVDQLLTRLFAEIEFPLASAELTPAEMGAVLQQSLEDSLSFIAPFAFPEFPGRGRKMAFGSRLRGTGLISRRLALRENWARATPAHGLPDVAAEVCEMESTFALFAALTLASLVRFRGSGKSASLQ
jgi:hypothetical protein